MSRCRDLLDSRVRYRRPGLHAQGAVALACASHYRVRIAYKGTNYHGWQAQTANCDDEALPSVQGTIHRTLKKISRYRDCTISATSRTDAGVHAQGQIGKITLPVDIEPETLLRGMNSMLPISIRILECARCEAGFNPKVGATSKEYHYYFSSEPVASPLIADVVAHVPGPLDWERLHEATEVFMGQHDFYNFCRRSSNAATTIRRVFACELRPPQTTMLMDDVRVLRFVGEGFLKQMIRYMASTIFEVARGNLSVEQVERHLRAHSDEKLCAKAPAHGLHLIAISGF